MLTIAAAGLIALTATLGAAPAKAPPPANQLYGVSCPSANDCVAVGINENAEATVKGGGALIQTWNGKAWSSVAPKAPKGALSTDLLGVSCATAKSCVAVGLYLNSRDAGVPLAETWNGKRWTPGTPARPAGSTGGQLDNVSCRTAKSCVAVGSYDTPAGSAALAETWNGTSWTMARPPEPQGSVTGELLKLSCPSATYCLAVGLSSSNTAEFALADRWNGNGWTRTPVQPPASAKHDADLTGVSCTSAENCVAVGVGVARTGGGVTSFAEFWNGRAWSAGTIAWPTGVIHPFLVAVSCGSARSCVAVGSVDADFNDGGHTGKAAATAWNGKTWTAGKVAAPGKGKASLFNEVSCPAAAACVAVGQLGPYNSDEGSGLAGFRNGKSWKLGTTP
jgi:hypothetical protein